MRTVALVAVCAAALGPARAAAQDRPWSLSFDLGSDVALSGDLHAGGTGVVLGLPTAVEARSYGDVYGAPFTWSAALGYAVTPTGEIRGRISYAKASADPLQVGTVAGLDLLGAFDDYVRVGVDVGYRQYLASAERTVRPFLGGSVGFARIDTLSATFSVPAAGVVLPDVPFLESSTVPALGGSAGVQIGLNEWLALQGSAEFQWHGDIGDVDGLAGTGLESINDETRRWSMPVSVGLALRF
jgi:hypothetical protein